jgi:hypothetical protein
VTRRRARPSPELVAAQRVGQAQAHRAAAAAPFAEKVRQVIELQRILYPVLRERGKLRPWEKPWDPER